MAVRERLEVFDSLAGLSSEGGVRSARTLRCHARNKRKSERVELLREADFMNQ